MPLNLPKPITYLITSGETTPQTAPGDKDFARLLDLIAAAVAAHVNLIQLREKNLSTRLLYDLTERAVEITHGTQTSLLVNDRADVARSAGADGVHLTSESIDASVIRSTFGADFLIGSSTHSLEQVHAAREAGSDFVVFGPVFETASKRVYGKPLGLRNLEEVVTNFPGFPVMALGGVTLENAVDCLRAGAAGVGAIRLMSDPSLLPAVVSEIKRQFGSQ
jgi:thiamine-phosphate pyrophosphorylase